MAVDVAVRQVMPRLPRAANLLKRVRESRFSHMQRVQEEVGRAETLRCEALEAIQDRSDKQAEAEVVAAKAEELRAQLQSFDGVCLDCFEQIQRLSTQDSCQIVARVALMLYWLVDCWTIARDMLSERQHCTLLSMLPVVGNCNTHAFLLSPQTPPVQDSPQGEQEEEEKASRYSLSNKLRQVKREVWRLQAALPALAARSEIQDNLREHGNLVVQGATGSGKSTQLPQYLAEQAGRFECKLCVAAGPM